jgi:hypothetical protein
MNKIFLGAGIIPIILALTTQTAIADNTDYQSGYNIGNKGERTGIMTNSCDPGWSNDFCTGFKKGFTDAVESYNGTSPAFQNGFDEGTAAANATNPTLPQICQPLNPSDFCIGFFKGYSFASVAGGH